MRLYPLFFFLGFGLIGIPTAFAGAIAESAKPWPNATVAYRIEPSILKPTGSKSKDCKGWNAWAEHLSAKKICRAMEAWHLATGVRFVYADQASKPYLMIVSSKTQTTATVGYGTINRMNVQSGATYGSVLHEFGHILGLMHEHQRRDRLDYLTFSGFIDGYLKTCTFVTEVCRDIRISFDVVKSSMQTEYDPCSLMHYQQNQSQRYPKDKRWRSIFTLTKSGQKAFDLCQQAFKGQPDRCRKVGQKCDISKLDAAIVRRFYGLT